MTRVELLLVRVFVGVIGGGILLPLLGLGAIWLSAATWDGGLSTAALVLDTAFLVYATISWSLWDMDNRATRPRMFRWGFAAMAHALLLLLAVAFFGIVGTPLIAWTQAVMVAVCILGLTAAYREHALASMRNREDA